MAGHCLKKITEDGRKKRQRSKKKESTEANLRLTFVVLEVKIKDCIMLLPDCCFVAMSVTLLSSDMKSSLPAHLTFTDYDLRQ